MTDRAQRPHVSGFQHLRLRFAPFLPARHGHVSNAIATVQAVADDFPRCAARCMAFWSADLTVLHESRLVRPHPIDDRGFDLDLVEGEHCIQGGELLCGLHPATRVLVDHFVAAIDGALERARSLISRAMDGGVRSRPV